MTRFVVELAPEALAQAEVVRSWWEANRTDAPSLFLDELTATLAVLEISPHIGRPYTETTLPGVRRLGMPRTRYHLYYVVDDNASRVMVYAVWHAARGAGPTLH